VKWTKVLDVMKIPFNKPPFFQNDFFDAVGSAASHGKFSGDGLNSKKCTEFFKDHYGYECSLLTPSCTAALEMTALLLDLGPGDEVIVPSFTFVTSANAFALRGVNLVFADSETDKPNVSVSDILKKVTNKTKAIVVVHYAGVPVDVHSILEKTSHAIPVVEDCAHAIDSFDPSIQDYIGKAGCLSTFSFHETKNIGIGEGGLLVVNDKKLWRKAQIIREKGTNRTDFSAGRVAFYTWVDLGSSYLMSDIDAAMLWSSLQHIDSIQNARLAIWDAYDQKLLSSNNVFKKPSRHFRANAHMYYLEFADTQIRTDFCKTMKEKGILVATHYVPLDTSPFMAEKACGEDPLIAGQACTQAAAWSKTLVRLPLFYDLTTELLNEVVAAVNNFALDKGIILAPATEDRWEAIRQLRNENSDGYVCTDQIGKDEHWAFMRKHCNTYRVAIKNGQCIGFIGHVNKDARLATSIKGKGVAQFMWKSFVQEVGDLDVKVLVNNRRSLSFFRKLGYIPDAKALEKGQNPIPLKRDVCKDEGIASTSAVASGNEREEKKDDSMIS